ncbi:MAG: response regulator [Aggregatilineales bacterium]
MNKPGAQGDKKTVIRVIIVDDIPETRENLKKLLAFESDIEVVGTAGTGKEGVELARNLKPDIVLMDINMPDMDGIQATELISKAIGAVGVIMMSVQHEADYLRRAMLAGARDFLTKPIAGDELYATIRRVYEIPKSGRIPDDREDERDKTAHDGHVIMVYSPQGGAGKTTVATNLAAALMRPDTKVLLIDADLQFGDVGVFLNLVAQASIVNLVKVATETDLDVDLVENVLIKHDTGLKVLLAPASPQDAENVPPETVLQLINKLKGLFDFIVVDTATRLDDLNLGLFDVAERIILVTISTLPALKNTRAVLNVLDALKYGEDKLVLVFNRVNVEHERNKVVPPVAALEDRLKRKALLSIPADERKVLTALTRGTPVFAGKDRTSSPAKEYLALAEALRTGLMPEELEPVAGPVKQSSRLSRLLGG